MYWARQVRILWINHLGLILSRKGKWTVAALVARPCRHCLWVIEDWAFPSELAMLFVVFYGRSGVTPAFLQLSKKSVCYNVYSYNLGHLSQESEYIGDSYTYAFGVKKYKQELKCDFQLGVVYG